MALTLQASTPSGHPLATKNTLSPASSVCRSAACSPLSLRHKHYRPLFSVILWLLRRGVLQHGVDAWNHHHTALGRSDGHAPRVRPLCHLVHPSLQLLRTPPHDAQVIREEEVGAGRFPGLSFSELG